MPSQEDYANVILALSTLASAPVAAYPESGAMMLAKQGQDRAVGKLADETAYAEPQKPQSDNTEVRPARCARHWELLSYGSQG